ncbi:hypothetical protein G7Y89_g414 [Cudoniella acicularis]|uniref:O-methyltransferase n=1 Tax=Cudoniella acicularis TaxID=354080 RepID=A0A8H4RY57_9HELO|nr:hypothetical protein G7Y89_g414 [Cudoniella acicularis]
MAHLINSKEAAAALTSVEHWICDALVAPDAALESTLKTNTEHSIPAIDVAPNEGKLLYMLAKMNNAKRILEVGTLGGYSAIWFAKALPEDGKLITLEINPERAQIAATNISNAGFASKVEIKLGPALSTLERMGAESTEPFDMIFIDADKDNNPGYFKWALKLSRKGTVIVVDNVVRYGKVIDKNNVESPVMGVRKLFEMLKVEKRVGTYVPCGESRSMMWDETERKLVFHRPQFVWFSSSKTKGKKHILSLSVDQLLKTKIAIRAIPSVRRRRQAQEDIYAWQNDCDRPEFDHEFHDASYTRTRKGPPIVDFVATYKIDEVRIPKLQAAVTVRKPPTCNQCPHPSRRCDFSNYAVSRPPPPTPPRRSSSLPKESRVIGIINNPSAPLAAFELSYQDRLFFQRLLTGSLNKIDYFSGTGLWSLMLQTCHVEPCIRHLILGTSMIHQTRSSHSDPRAMDIHRSAYRHYAKAIRLLNELLNNLAGEASSEVWEITLLASFLFTAFEILRRDEERAGWWIQSGKMLLKHATSAPSRVVGDFNDLSSRSESWI